MPKRKESLKSLSKKLKKLEKRIKEHDEDPSAPDIQSRNRSRSPLSRSSCPSSSQVSERHRRRIIPVLHSSSSSRDHSPEPDIVQSETQNDQFNDVLENQDLPILASVAPIDTEITPCPADQDQLLQSQMHTGLDPEILDILGIDPTSVNDFGENINCELANRLNHMASTGLNKDNRKELIDKYLIPGNCTFLGAPLINPEIKAAVSENVIKRDKAFVARQKELSAGLSCLSRILSSQLESKDKDPVLLKQLMDTAKLFCDIQYLESCTRRNLAIYSLKTEIRDQLYSTKIDKYLFGENLNETLKTAKAVSKSSSELARNKPSTPANRNLNWKATGSVNRSRQPAHQQRRQPLQPAAARPTRTQPRSQQPRSSTSLPSSHRYTAQSRRRK